MRLKENIEKYLEVVANVLPCPNCGSYSIVNVYDNNDELTNFDECEECGERWEVE